MSDTPISDSDAYSTSHATEPQAWADSYDEAWRVLGYLNHYLPAQYIGMNLSNIPEEVVREAFTEMMNNVRNPEVLSKEIRDRVINLSFATSGGGPYFNQIQTYLSCLDRYKANILPVNTIQSGLTFITRPRLCLQSSNLRNNRRMAALDTLNPNSIAFMIRCLLDTNFHKINNRRYEGIVHQSPLIDPQNPFLTPLCNSLISISGFPDFSIQTQTTDGGYQQEAQTFAVGADDFNRATYSLNLNFKDIQHGPVSAILYYWMEYIRCVTRGLMLAYADDIDEQRLNYTVSIYRFALDPTRTYITDWCKCTGCFPTSLNTGSILQVNEGEEFVRAAQQLSVTFACNKVEYRDYAIFMDFNTLMQRYCPEINVLENASAGNMYGQPDAQGIQNGALRHPNMPKEPYTNFRGLPWITSDMHGPRLEFRRTNTPVYPYHVFTDSTDTLDALLYLDMMRSTKNMFAETYTPEYYKEREKFKDLGSNIQEFFQRVLADKTNDSKSFKLPPKQ